MYDLGIQELVLKFPTRIYERIEENPILQKIKGTDRIIEILVEIGGVQYACGLDTSTKLVDALEALEKGKELIKPDYADRWKELTSSQETVDRYVVLAPYGDTLAIKAVGLDPNDSKHFFIKVTGRHRPVTRNKTH